MDGIRRATEQDALGIAIVNVYTWKTAYAGLMSDAVLDARIQGLRERAQAVHKAIRRGEPFSVAEADGAIVGFCMYGETRNEAYQPAGEIYALNVLAGFQSAGLGRALFTAGAQALAAAGHTRLLINCLRGNPALDFYRRMGGRVVGQRHDEFQGYPMTEDIMLFDGLDMFRAGGGNQSAPV